MAAIRIGEEVCVRSTGATGVVTDSNGHSFKVLGMWVHGADLGPGGTPSPPSGGTAEDPSSPGTATLPNSTVCIGDEVCVTSTGASGIVTDSNGHSFKVAGVWVHSTDIAPGQEAAPPCDSPSGDTISSDAKPAHVKAPLGPTVYICNAEDCAFLGSGAALVEIEELFAEAACPIKVQFTECIKGCGQGANVRLERTCGEDGVQISVNSFQRCAEVALDARFPTDSKERPGPEQPAGGFKAKMLRNRSNNMRWKALVTAMKHEKYGRDASAVEKALKDAESSEYGAARVEDADLESTQAMDRATRRWQRIRVATSRALPAPTKSEEPQQRTPA